MDFQNRKWNYPNRKWNYFSYFQASDQKTSFKKYFSFSTRNSELIFKTGNRIIQTGNGIFYPISRPPIKKPLLHNISHFNQGVQNSFSKQEMELSNQEMEFFLHFQASNQKTSFTRCFTFFARSFKLIFKTGNRMIKKLLPKDLFLF